MSSQPLNRTYSFDYQDETALRPGQRQPLHQHSQPYRDQSPERAAYYPNQPPAYMASSPPPRNATVSPPSPPGARFHPGAHPGSAFSELQASRQQNLVNAQAGGPPAFSRDRGSYAEPHSPTYHQFQEEQQDGGYFPQQETHPESYELGDGSRSQQSHVSGQSYGQPHRKPVAAVAPPIPYGSLPAPTGTSTSGQSYAQHYPPSHPELPVPTEPSITQGDRSIPVTLDPRQDFTQSPLPAPPVHMATEPKSRQWGSQMDYTNSRSTNSTTPGMDNLGEASAGGGLAGLAMGVAATNERDSGVQALHAIENHGHAGPPGLDALSPPNHGIYPVDLPAQPALSAHNSYGSHIGLVGHPGSPPAGTPGPRDYSSSQGSHPSYDRFISDNGGHYTDNPYNAVSTTWDPRLSAGNLGMINPNDLADDGDDGLQDYYAQGQKRRSVMSLTNRNSRGDLAAAGGAAAAGGVLGGILGAHRRGASHGNVLSKPAPATAGGAQYGPLTNSGSGTGSDPGAEKAAQSEWLQRQEKGSKKWTWIIVAIVVLLVLGGIGGGVAAALLTKKKGSSSSAIDGGNSKNPLSSTSPEVNSLLNNKNLKKVFPGIDYTPLNAQYPACLSNMPIQNNVTLDMAVLSQLTNQVRLYGTDCNQTEMVIQAIQDLGDAAKDMKVWLGVWQENNATTNARQLAAMYDLLEKYKADPFAGIIVGNEVLFRKDMTEAQLAQVLEGVKQNLTTMSIDLPLATSDLGDNWQASLVSAVDIVMANIHPFFGGVQVDQAAGWTWNFWQQHDVVLTAGLTGKKNLISETGWPSQGGTDGGSVAGISEMNTFMEDWVCGSLTNGTSYFWFEAFDEPWKIQYDTPGQDWEDHWGLMDINRNLKSGLVIPDCNGQRAS